MANWIQKAFKSIKKRGTEGVCTGNKYGGPSCPPGSKRYNMAKTLRKMAKSRKKKQEITMAANRKSATGGKTKSAGGAKASKSAKDGLCYCPKDPNPQPCGMTCPPIKLPGETS